MAVQRIPRARLRGRVRQAWPVTLDQPDNFRSLFFSFSILSKKQPTTFALVAKNILFFFGKIENMKKTIFEINRPQPEIQVGPTLVLTTDMVTKFRGPLLT